MAENISSLVDRLVRNYVAVVRNDLVRTTAGEPVRAEMENYAASSMKRL